MTIRTRRTLATAALLASLSAIVVGCQPAAVLAPKPVATSAVAACQAPQSVQKAGAAVTFDWHVAVQEDRPAESVVLFVSGMDQMLCEAARSPDGSFGTVATSLGRLDPVVGSPLTYDTGTDPGAGPAGGRLVAVGRTPLGTTSVEVTTTAGDVQSATLGDGFYLAWFTNGDSLASIVAQDTHGAELGRLEDPQGLDAGAVASPGPSS